MERKTYTISEARVILGVGRDAMYKLVKDENFPKLQVGKKIIIPIQPFEKWLNNTLEN